MKDIKLAKRLQKLPPYLFAEIDKQKKELKEKGIDFIDLSIGDPDIYAPKSVIETLYEASKIKENQKYSLDIGKENLRKEIASWFEKRFSVKLEYSTEILPLIGSKEGLVHLPLAFLNPSDYIIIPNPSYPGYRGAAILSGAKIYEMKLDEKNSFLPLLNKIPLSVRNKAKIIYINYPNNPTTKVAPFEFLEELVRFCLKYGIIIAYDNAYSEIYFEKKPHSILEVKGAKEIAIEFHSFSKTFCMTGFRIGWAAGNQKIINGLLKLKTNIDSGIFGAIQDAAAFALKNEEDFVVNLRKIFKERRDVFVSGLLNKGFKNVYTESTFYVWAKLPENFNSIDYVNNLLKTKKIVATPGVGFGKFGEGFIRFALTVDVEVLKKALLLI